MHFFSYRSSTLLHNLIQLPRGYGQSPPKDLKEEPLVNIRLYDNHSYLPLLETVNHTVAAADRPKQLRFMQWYAAVVCGMLVMQM